jgi:hypothetical protein
MSALKLFVGLLTAPIRLVQIARDFDEKRPAIVETAIGWNPAENQDNDGGWTRIEADRSPSGETEYQRIVRPAKGLWTK